MSTSVDELRNDARSRPFLQREGRCRFVGIAVPTSQAGSSAANCGTATGQETAGASGGPATSSPQGKDPRGEAPIGDLGITENAAAALCYFLLPAAIFLVIEPYRDSRFIRFHCFQAIFCAAAILIARAIVTTIVSAIIGFLAYVLRLADRPSVLYLWDQDRDANLRGRKCQDPHHRRLCREIRLSGIRRSPARAG